MVYRLIHQGTVLNIDFKDKIANSKITHKGFLHEPVRDIVLLLEGDDLYEYCSALPRNTLMSIAFYRGQTEFSFEAKLESVLMKNDKKLTEVTAIGVIKENSRRLTRRFLITVDVGVFTQKDNLDLRPVCSGQSYDISCDSISIWSSDNLAMSSTPYYVRFVLFNRDVFNLPAKLLRRKNAPSTSMYRNEYVLLYDFASDMREKNRLLDAFIRNFIEMSKL